jgi:hypothetical protein
MASAIRNARTVAATSWVRNIPLRLKAGTVHANAPKRLRVGVPGHFPRNDFRDTPNIRASLNL